jgi:tight adherence protein B
MQLLILAAVFFGTLLAIISGYLFVNRRRLAASEAALAQLAVGGQSAGGTSSILRDERSSEIPFLNRLLSGRELTGTIALELAKAGSKRRPGEVIVATVGAGVLGLVLGQRAGAVAALVGAAIGALVPTLLIKRAQKQRAAQLEAQLPEALDMVVNALKAGYSLQAAIEFVGTEVAAPLGPEFSRFYDEQRLGIDVRTALIRMRDRIGTVDASMFVTALLIQRESGGNLAEVLGNLATLMRERAAFKGQVETLTAESRASAKVLSALPLAVYLAISWLNPEFMRPLLDREIGHYVLAYAAVSTIVGYFVMTKLAVVDM